MEKSVCFPYFPPRSFYISIHDCGKISLVLFLGQIVNSYTPALEVFYLVDMAQIVNAISDGPALNGINDCA